jgi:TonB family protein
VYPEEAIRLRTTGLVVVEVCVQSDGLSFKSRIVTAPSRAIAQSVTDALAQWRFEPNEKPRSYGGKLTYYFVEQRGEWKVFNAGDSFFVGPRFALKQQERSVGGRPERSAQRSKRT